MKKKRGKFWLSLKFLQQKKFKKIFPKIFFDKKFQFLFFYSFLRERAFSGKSVKLVNKIDTLGSLSEKNIRSNFFLEDSLKNFQKWEERVSKDFFLSMTWKSKTTFLWLFIDILKEFENFGLTKFLTRICSGNWVFWTD